MLRVLDTKDTLFQSEENRGMISFLDYNPPSDEVKDEDGIPLGLGVFQKFIEFSKDISELDEEKEFLKEINKYVKPTELLEITDNSRRNLSKFISAGSMVAVAGRRGPAHNVLISRSKFEEILEQEERDSLQRMYKVYFSKDEDLDYALIWRSGATDEPGCILVKNKDKYVITSLGYYPEHQYVKIML